MLLIADAVFGDVGDEDHQKRLTKRNDSDFRRGSPWTTTAKPGGRTEHTRLYVGLRGHVISSDPGH